MSIFPTSSVQPFDREILYFSTKRIERRELNNMISAKKYIKWGCMLISGLLFITTALITYIPLFVENFGPEIELTLISNLFAGILFFCGGVYGITKKKEFPQVVYMDSVVLLQLVFLICMAFIGEFNFSGAFVFLHIVNPILATLELIVFTAH